MKIREPLVMRAAVACLLALMLLPGARAASESSPGRSSPLTEVNAALERGDYARAMSLLKPMVDESPRDADALNLMGYSLRKSGDRAGALQFYERALAVEPRHRGANEYLGELYLEMDELAKAEERLKVLDGACFFTCSEFSELEEAIEVYKKQKGLK